MPTKPAAANMSTDHGPPLPGSPWGRRLLWLALCVAGGAAVAAIGFTLTGLQAWALAVPAAVAAGWLVFGTPQHCQPPDGAMRTAKVGRAPAPSSPAADNAGDAVEDTR
jgi:hypothetical protein